MLPKYSRNTTSSGWKLSIRFSKNKHKRTALILTLTFASILLITGFANSSEAIGFTHSASPLTTEQRSYAAGNGVAPEVINTTQFGTTEPYPMGIADFGIGPGGTAYDYSTTSFLGIIHLSSISTDNSGDYNMSFQLNVMLQFTSQLGVSYVYWIQNCAVYDTQQNVISIENNVWNMSVAGTTNLVSSGISGNGTIYTNQGIGGRYYNYDAPSYLPIAEGTISLPSLIELQVNSTINSLQVPQVNFAFNDGQGWQEYDTVSFPLVRNPIDYSGFVVNGRQNDPYGNFYDAELIAGGEAGGANTVALQSNLTMQLEYWNGHNYQEVYDAYNHGADSAEGISNVTSSAYYYDNGSLGEELSAGAGGSLGVLYDRSQVSIVSVESPVSSGTLVALNLAATMTATTGTTTASATLPTANLSRYPFVGGEANVTIQPGSYTFYIYDDQNNLVSATNATLGAGQYLALNLSSVTNTTSITSISSTSSSSSSSSSTLFTLTTNSSNNSNLTTTSASSSTSVATITSTTTPIAPLVESPSFFELGLAVAVAIVLAIAGAVIVLISLRRRQQQQ